MKREEAYAKIKELGLQDEVKKAFGRNFTQVPTAELEHFLLDNNSTEADKAPDTKETPQAESTTPTVGSDSITAITPSTPIAVENPYEAACLTFLGILKDADLLDTLLKKL